MNTRIWWALLGASLLFGALGCSEVENCKPGERGCIGGGCQDDDDCKFDLRCLVDTDSGSRVCGAKRGGTFDCGEDVESCRETDPVPQCNCEAGEVCAPGTTDKCINYCEEPEVARGSLPTPGSCQRIPNEAVPDLVPLTYEEACITRCLQRCAQQAVYCPSACDPAACASAEELQACEDLCPAAAENALECITDACIATGETACGDVACPDGTEPECGDAVCENDCEFNHDGECDDGDFASASYAGCNWGTDCADCGPRRGVAQTALGDLCIADWACEDYRGSAAQNNAWCVQIEGLPQGVKRCVPDCTRGQLCPDGYACATVEPNDPELRGASTKACYPVICQ